MTLIRFINSVGERGKCPGLTRDTPHLGLLVLIARAAVPCHRQTSGSRKIHTRARKAANKIPVDAILLDELCLSRGAAESVGDIGDMLAHHALAPSSRLCVEGGEKAAKRFPGQQSSFITSLGEFQITGEKQLG